MFFTSNKEINRLRKETNMILSKTINKLFSKGINMLRKKIKRLFSKAINRMFSWMILMDVVYFK